MLELWFILALLGVFGKTTFYTLQKRLLDDDVSSLKLGYITSLYGFAILGPIGGFKLISNPPSVSAQTYGIVAVLGIIELVGFWMYLKALSLCDMSIASPMKKMKPILVAITEPILLGTHIGPVLIASAAGTGIGGYIVLLKKKNFLAPFKRLKEPGPALALGTAGIYTLLSIGSRFGNSKLPTSVFALIVYSIMLFGFAIFLHRSGDLPSINTLTSRKFFAVGSVGVFRTVMVWSAYGLASATHVSLVTQLTVILDVFVGGTLLKEENTKTRLAGAVMILVGVFVAYTY